MVESTQSVCLTPQEKEVFSVLVLRYLDGDCTTAELQELKATLLGNAPYRELLVDISRLHGELHEVYAPRRAAVLQKKVATAEPVLAAQSVHEVAGTFRPDPPNDRQPLLKSAETEADGEVSEDQRESVETPDVDPGAETIVRELSAEDTIHREPKPSSPS